jgi:SAM-dependent methyltransferase
MAEQRSSRRLFATTLFPVIRCPVCRDAEAFRTHYAREMLLGTRDEFTYAECGGCRSLWLTDPPADIARYYPLSGYVPFTATVESESALKHLAKTAMTELVARGVIGRRGHWTYPLYLTRARRRDHILDVGSGSGLFLMMLHQRGYANLTGVDPFAQPGPFTQQGTIEDVEGKFDLIFFNDSLEHVPSPLDALTSASKLLAEDGRVVVKVPLADSHAWRVYGTNWFQLDPPRHLTVPTRDGVRIVAERAGLRVVRAVDDSSALQFWASELYRQGIPFTENHGFADERIQAWEKEAKSLNRRNEGDHATFVLMSS